MPSVSNVERVWFPATLKQTYNTCNYRNCPAMNNIDNSSWADAGSPNTDRACAVTVGVDVAASSSSSCDHLIRRRNPRKKITKLMRIMEEGVKVKGKGGYKKPDPDAPKITRPCTECGKRFWSWKALFGHMRCHPKRHWRGINPPRTLIRPPPQEDVGVTLTPEEHEVAACLLLLASGKEKERANDDYDIVVDNVVDEEEQEQRHERFECSSCNKVFGSHHALGGHRASQKNVKGCFDLDHDHLLTHPDDAAAGGGHKCSICLKVFSTDDTAPSPVDLYLPPALDQQQHNHCSLDLRLGV